MGRLKQKKKFALSEVTSIMSQLLLTLDFMANNHIVHRDIKPENILLGSKDPNTFDIRLGDLGLAAELPQEKYLKQRCGTPGYIAPEMLLAKAYNEKVDIFSAGVVMFNLLTKKLLF
mmetsp:Transcript_26982/g.20185  ORF Transcript_26982/g.20185 Transcript_26982/m.20185 type:complete len:117 (-) Transcript_26982:994-1344(-)